MQLKLFSDFKYRGLIIARLYTSQAQQLSQFLPLLYLDAKYEINSTLRLEHDSESFRKREHIAMGYASSCSERDPRKP